MADIRALQTGEYLSTGMHLPSFLLRNVGEKRSGDGDGLRNGASHAIDNLPEERAEDKESTKRWSWTSFRRRSGGQLGKGKRGNGDRMVTEDETSMRNNSKKWHWKAVAGTRTETENHGSTRTGAIGVGNGNATATAPTPASTSHPIINASTGNNRVEVETLQEPGESEAARVEFEDDTTAHGLVSTEPRLIYRNLVHHFLTSPHKSAFLIHYPPTHSNSHRLPSATSHSHHLGTTCLSLTFPHN